MKDIVINDRTFKDIPENFDDVTIKQYERLFKNITEDMNYMEQQAVAVSELYNIPLEEIYDINGGVFSVMVDEVLFIFELYDGKIENSVNINKIDYYIPAIGDMSLRQYIDIEETVKDKKFSYTELLSVLLVLVGKDYIKLSNELVEELPISKLFPLMYYFFKQGKSMNQLTEAYLKLMQNHKVLDGHNSVKTIIG